jgi:hypothetical protein
MSPINASARAPASNDWREKDDGSVAEEWRMYNIFDDDDVYSEEYLNDLSEAERLQVQADAEDDSLMNTSTQNFIRAWYGGDVPTRIMYFTVGGRNKVSIRGDRVHKERPMIENWNSITRENMPINPAHENIYILTGHKSYMTILDFDDMNSFETFKDNIPYGEYEDRINFGDIFTVKTPRGVHLYFIYDPRLISGRDTLSNCNKVDILNDDRIAMAPSSKRYIDRDGVEEVYKYRYLHGYIDVMPERLFSCIKREFIM